MKIQTIILSFGLLFFVAGNAGCSPPTESVATPSTASPTALLSVRSSTGTITPTITPAATDTPTSLAIPTLPVEQARNRLLELLANNGGCRLPCLWSIAPGKSNYQEGRAILLPLSSVAETVYFDSSSPDDISPFYVEGDLRLNIRVAYLYGNDGIVSGIAFRAREEQVATDSNGNLISTTPIYGLPTFIKRVEYYSLAHLLSEQGLPTSVMITSAGPSINRRGSIFTQIVVLYPNQGIWARYTTLVNEYEVGSIIKSCPINAHVEMDLYPAGNPDSFYTLLDKTDWGTTKNSYKPLQEATMMSVEQFYETFRQQTEKCIETPVKIWPTQKPGGG